MHLQMVTITHQHSYTADHYFYFLLNV